MPENKKRRPTKVPPAQPAETGEAKTTGKSPKREGKLAPERPARAAKTARARSVPPSAPAAPSRPRRKPTTRSVVEASPAKAPAEAPLSILMVSSEAHPFAKTGGLAEVVGSLPSALARLGHYVTIILPRYRGVDVAGAAPMPASFRLGGATVNVAFFTRDMEDGVRAVLVDAPELFDREGLYGTGPHDFPDNGWRFAVLSRAALEYARVSGIRPSIIHAHDWQAGLVPVFQKMIFSSDPVVGRVPVVFTIHNMAFQGVFPADIVPALGLPGDVLHVDAMEYWGQVSFLKAGINFSEKITTVSPTYSREILTPELGFGLQGALARRAADVTGILNGIDIDRWNPARDVLLPAAYTADDLSGKTAIKRALLEAAGLPADEAARARPTIGLISRLTYQKGFDILAAATGDLMTLDASWVLLGSGDREYEDLWRRLADRHPDRVATTIGFDERFAHLIEGGADIFLMPSRFEPCGLNQLYSLRYGTVPVVRATGGLEDTVRDADERADGNGFKFAEPTAASLMQALGRALAARRDPIRWKEIQQRGMREDHSWDASAREYVKVYRTV